MVAAWLITLPSAAIVGALMWWISHLVGGLAGAVAIFLLLCAAAAGMWLRSRRDPVGWNNVNDEWPDGASTRDYAAS
jgi:PiT family inorganic phosphate transporter